jgi:cytochrome b561
MSRRATAWLAWSLWALCVLVIVSGWLLAFLTRHDVASYVGFVGYVLQLAFPTIGALVASRRPENPLGWLLCCISLLAASQTLTLWYSRYGLYEHAGALPGVEITAWL